MHKLYNKKSEDYRPGVGHAPTDEREVKLLKKYIVGFMEYTMNRHPYYSFGTQDEMYSEFMLYLNSVQSPDGIAWVVPRDSSQFESYLRAMEKYLSRKKIRVVLGMWSCFKTLLNQPKYRLDGLETDYDDDEFILIVEPKGVRRE